MPKSPEWLAGYQAGYLDGTREAEGYMPDPVNGSYDDDGANGDYSVGYNVGFNQGYDDNVNLPVSSATTKPIADEAGSTASPPR
jgi:hypothetical protein